MSDKKQHNFEVGQVIYLLSERAEAIVPAIIIEEQLVKKLDGNSISWKVAVGPPNKRREIDTNNLQGEVHVSLEDIREVMLKELTNFINKTIEEAKKRTETWYGQQIAEKPKQDGTGGKIDPAALMNSIDGGQDELFMNKSQQVQQTQPSQQNPMEGKSFRVKVPQPGTGPLVNIDPNDPKADMKRRLVELATPEDFDNSDEEEFMGEGEFVMTEDGRRVPVKYNVNN